MKKILVKALFPVLMFGFEGVALAEVFSMKVSDFVAVSLRIPADVVWSDTDKPTCIVECSPELEKKMEVVMEGNTLVIRGKEKSWSGWNYKDGTIKIKLTGSRLEKITIQGSGDFKMNSPNDSQNFSYAIHGSGDLQAQVKAKSCDGVINGSGDVVLSGNADSFNLAINGSGDVKATAFQCRKVNVRIAGSGDAQVFATESLDVKISGSGDVAYKGEPKHLVQKVSGSGELRKI